MSITANWDDKKWQAFANNIKKRLSATEIDRVIEANAYTAQKLLVNRLPKRTGALRRSWIVQKKGIGQYQVASMSKVALFLEEGTKAHGPKTSKFLYIPLRPGAARWRKGFVWGQDYILVKRVKGIAAQRYLMPIADDTLELMVRDFMNHLERAA